MSDNENYSSDENDSDNESEILSEKSEKEESDNEQEINVKKNIIASTKVEDSDDEDDEENEKDNKEDSDYENNEDDIEDDVENDDELEEQDEGGEVEDIEEKVVAKKGKKSKQTVKPQVQLETSDEEEDDDDDDDTQYLQKFNSEINKNYIMEHHPECVINNYDEISSLTSVIRDKNNNIIDDLHRTLPYLTKYERARILGQRAKQINSGAKVFVKVPENIIDGYLIAQMELEQKRIPFIIKRPIPGGGCEYWNLKDLEIVGF
jgi:DNA-directed RNA polymerase subunit K/omega|uniref:DNA-directed RNA polymerase n=1 Tax=viral metagenome TaxID=1070528 RepID=A0A6C0CVJ7_9ZZZZ